MMISKTVSGTSVESTIKSYLRRKDGQASFFALYSNQAGNSKYWSIVKSISNLLQNIKWNGRNYPLEQYVSNHWTAIYDFYVCATHIGNAIPNIPQMVELLLESINSQDNDLQAAMGNIRSNTNVLRSDFEGSSSHLIEVDL